MGETQIQKPVVVSQETYDRLDPSRKLAAEIMVHEGRMKVGEGDKNV